MREIEREREREREGEKEGQREAPRVNWKTGKENKTHACY